jgi:hypothetical protein
MDKKEVSGRLAQLRKYISSHHDAEMVKEMISDGLSNEDIMHALGHVDAQPTYHVLPNGHEHSNVMTSEQREEQAAGLLQPGEEVGEDSEEGDEEGGQDAILTHVAGLLSHVAKGKPKKSPKGSPSGSNRR